MKKIRLGKTEIMVSKLGFGGVPIQRPSDDEAVAVLRRCLDRGITFFDTADNYGNSEERIGKAISGRREGLILATKYSLRTRQDVESHLKQSLKRLGVASVDLYQFHGVNDSSTYAQIIDPQGPLSVVRDARKKGLVKHIGITTHSMDVAKQAVKSDLFETIMFPFNFVTCEPADELLPLTREHDVGFIAMKPLAGGKIENINIAFKYLRQFPDVTSIPGFQRVREVDELAQLFEGPQQMTKAEQSEMEQLREQLTTRFCRRCNYCLPCPEEIPIPMIVDIPVEIMNMPPQTLFSDRFSAPFDRAATCSQCGDCDGKCPYGLPVIELIAENVNLYRAEKKKYQEHISK